MLCRKVLEQKCSKGHNQSWQCHEGTPLTCSKCEHDVKQAAKRAQRALDEKNKRDQKTKDHLEAVAKIDEEMEQITQRSRDALLDFEQRTIIAQKIVDLAAVKERAQRNSASSQKLPAVSHNEDEKDLLDSPDNEILPHSPTPAAPKSTLDRYPKTRNEKKTTPKQKRSPAETEWQRQKDQENAQNPAIDKIMEMTGLESVKAQILRIMSKVQTAIRQGTDLIKERLGLVLLGNPGTGNFLWTH